MNVWDEDDGGEWLEISDCAKLIGCTLERVLELVRRRALRTRHAYGVTLVQPAMLSGSIGSVAAEADSFPTRRGR